MRSGSYAIMLVLALAWSDDVEASERASVSAEQIERARSNVLGEDLQPALPGLDDGPLAGSGSARSLNPDGTIDTRELTRDRRIDQGLGLLGEIVQVLMYIGLAIGVVLLVFLLVTELAAVNHDVELPAEGPRTPEGPDLAVIERPLADAEELAARGEYREAIHTLLLRTLRELVRSTAIKVPPSLTSREILARVPLHDDPRAALAELISAVELTHFGDDTATESDYLRCKAQFQRFAASFRAAGART